MRIKSVSKIPSYKEAARDDYRKTVGLVYCAKTYQTTIAQIVTRETECMPTWIKAGVANKK